MNIYYVKHFFILFRREALLRNIRSDSVVEDSLSSSLTKSPTSTTLKSDDDLLRLLENNSAEI